MTKVLLIEDNLEIRENLAEILELEGYQVMLSATGKEALSTVMADKPQVILCDIMMPEMNGYEVFTHLKKNTNTADIPFVFVTANAEKKELQSALKMGANGYICKPFDAPELLEAIKRCLK